MVGKCSESMLPRDAELEGHRKAADAKQSPIIQSNKLFMAVIHIACGWKILTVQDLQGVASNHLLASCTGENTEVLGTYWNWTQLGFFLHIANQLPELEQNTGFSKPWSLRDSQLLPPSDVSAEVIRL